mmetsp:Transcript_29719/g.53954  ORF Transcript_29719/g.53954 Transcript_29719/m.53954 type:complete len:255 (-) Transcript_29719:267-1031(-)
MASRMLMFVEEKILLSLTAPIEFALHQDSNALKAQAAVLCSVFPPPVALTLIFPVSIIASSPRSSLSLNESIKIGPIAHLKTDGTNDRITSFVPAGHPFPTASMAICDMIATTANGANESLLGTIQSDTRCRTAAGPVDTALAATTPHSCSIAMGSEKDDRGYCIMIPLLSLLILRWNEKSKTMEAILPIFRSRNSALFPRSDWAMSGLANRFILWPIDALARQVPTRRRSDEGGRRATRLVIVARRRTCPSRF